MGYINQTLTFDPDKIYYYSEDWENNIEVMMDWEDPLMSASAAYVCEGGGDILEIGFGMGISAGYIHSHSISSHTIIENHPQIISKSREWANGKSNVTIVSQSWYDVRNSLGAFDGIFYDTFKDENMGEFSSSLSSLTKSGTKVTMFWGGTNDTSSWSPSDRFDIKSFQTIDINVEDNSYYDDTDTYYLPKKEF